MTIDSELRDRLGGALDTISPGSPPVGPVIRRGKAIRIRRRTGTAIAAATVIGLGVALPLGIQPTSTPPAHSGSSVTVNSPRIGASQLIFTGAIDGRNWRFTLTYSQGRFLLNGPGGYSAPGPDASTAGEPANLAGFTRGSLAVAVGSVRADVARLTERLPNGLEVRLRPVWWHGAGWVGLAVPLHPGMGSLTAYSRGGTEIAHAVPIGLAGYAGWLRPGQRGLPRQTVLLGSGMLAGKNWKVTALSGPWGICVRVGRSDYCNPSGARLIPHGQLVGLQVCGGGLGAGQADPDVRQLRLRFSDGSVQRVPAVSIIGRRFFAFAFAKGLRFTRWTAYGAAGQRLGSGAGWRAC
jgi:hypothetical protein